MIDIGEKLRKLRESNNLTRKEAVDKLHVLGIEISDKTLYGYESGRNSANADMFLALCKIYNCTNIASEFSNTSDDVLFTNAEWELLEKYRKLDSHGKEMVNFILDKEYEKMYPVKNFLISKGGSLIYSLQDNLTVNDLSLWKLDDDTYTLVETILNGSDFSRFSELEAIDFGRGFVLPMALKNIKLIDSHHEDIRIQCTYLVQNMTNDIYNAINNNPLYPFDLTLIQDLIVRQDIRHLGDAVFKFADEEIIRE